jgi:hypothetical protein
VIAFNRAAGEHIYEELALLNPLAVAPKGFERAYIGFTVGLEPSVAVFDYDKCVEIICDEKNVNEEDAIEYLNFSVVFAHFGKNYPVYVQLKNPLT